MAEVKNIAEAQGCQYWVRHSTLQFLIDGRWIRSVPPNTKPAKTKGRSGEQCLKHIQDGMPYCPHHVLVIEHEAQRFKRAGQKAADSRAYKRQQAEILEKSPLRATNPIYKGTAIEPQGAYSEPKGRK